MYDFIIFNTVIYCNKIITSIIHMGLLNNNFRLLRKSCSVRMAVFEIVVHRNVDNWIPFKAVRTNIFAKKNMCCINLQLLILFIVKWIISDMHHRITYMHINFQQNCVIGSVKTVLTNIFTKKMQVAYICNYTNNIFFNQLLQTCIIIKRTCISIFSNIGFVDQSKPCTQMYLPKIAIKLHKFCNYP